MVPGWVPFKIVSDSPALHSRWPLLLKIEISSNGQNCSILSQNVPKFELYKHNDELFSIYYWIFYELWTFADFDRLCKLEKRGDEILKKSSPRKLLSQYQQIRQILLKWFLANEKRGDAPFQNCVRWSRLPTKMAAKLKIEKRGDEILIVHCCFSVSQNELKF